MNLRLCGPPPPLPPPYIPGEDEDDEEIEKDRGEGYQSHRRECENVRERGAVYAPVVEYEIVGTHLTVLLRDRNGPP